jgi:hypothetical protein
MLVLRDYRAPEIVGGIDAGVEAGWWLHAPHGRIIPTPEGVSLES